MDNRRVIIIDDDPTGCQTVRNIPVLLSWDEDTVRDTLKAHPALFILTNTRALPSREAKELSRDVCTTLKNISSAEGYDLSIISRSDSTLRGHLCEELLPLMESFPDRRRLVIAPVFFECGRITRNNIHYLIKDDKEIPVSETEFASDPTFGYSNSDLRLWVEEVSSGKFKASRCITIDAESCSEELFLGSDEESIFILNSSSYEELDTIVSCIKRVESKGLRFTFRTAASFVRSYLGQDASEFWKPLPSEKKGLIVAGSYTDLTTRQLNYLKEHEDVVCFEIDVNRISYEYCRKIAEFLDTNLAVSDCLLYTTRSYTEPPAGDTQLAFAEKISSAICQIVSGLTVKPGFTIVKGGITSLTVARDAFGIRSTEVVGQIDAGIPVWKDIDGDCFVVFPGNVGRADTLDSVYRKFL